VVLAQSCLFFYHIFNTGTEMIL